MPTIDPRSTRPIARHEGLLSTELEGEILIYDEGQQLACRLNRSAAQVWTLSDGTRTVAELAELVTPGLGDVDLVLVALDQLQQHGLLEDGYPEHDEAAVEVSRRRFMRRIGVVGAAAAIVPVVEAAVMPTAAQAISIAPVPPP